MRIVNISSLNVSLVHMFTNIAYHQVQSQKKEVPGDQTTEVYRTLVVDQRVDANLLYTSTQRASRGNADESRNEPRL